MFSILHSYKFVMSNWWKTLAKLVSLKFVASITRWLFNRLFPEKYVESHSDSLKQLSIPCHSCIHITDKTAKLIAEPWLVDGYAGDSQTRMIC